MRFKVDYSMANPKLPKDKNIIFMSQMKMLFENTSKEVYLTMYEGEKNKVKDFTFSLFLGKGVEFLREEIVVPDQKIILNFSTSSLEEGILFYNSYIDNLGLEIPIKNNTLTIEDINLIRENPIMDEEIIVRSLSPICVREHRQNDNSKTWYHNLATREGQEILLENLKYQIKDKFPNIKREDLDGIKIEVVENKLVKIKHMDIVLPSNIGILKIRARSYILDYIYASGLGSRRGQGFGYLERL